MRVNDIKASLTPNDFAIVTALSTKRSQLVISNTRPPTTFAMDFHNGTVAGSRVTVEALFLSRTKEMYIKATKTNSNSAPSTRLIPAAGVKKKSKAKRVSSTDTPTHNGNSNFTFLRSVATGKKRAVSPNIPKTLNIFEPTTFPIATSELPLSAPIKLTTNSGIEVPIPTITAPTTKSDTPYFLATDTEPVTRKSAPNTIPASDAKRITYSILFQQFTNLAYFMFINFGTSLILVRYILKQLEIGLA